MKSKIFKLLFVFVFLLILLALIRTFISREEFVSREVEYNDWKNNIKFHTSDILSAKVDYNAIVADEIDRSVYEEKQKYNNRLCNNYVRLYKLSSSPEMTSPRKARLRTNYVDNVAVFDSSMKKCVHPTDSSYQSDFQCPPSIECPNSGVMSGPGKKVIQNFDAMCEYECV